MKPERIICIAMLTVVMFSLSATDSEECFALSRFFNKPEASISQEIDGYRRRLLCDPTDVYANLAIGILYDALSASNDPSGADASKNAVLYIRRFEKSKGDDPLALTYLGLGYSLVSRDSRNPIAQLVNVKAAIDAFERAVVMAEGRPRGWYSRYMRANFYMNLPSSFGKRAAAEEDIAFVLDAYGKDPALEPFLCPTMYYRGEIENARGETGQALYYWGLSVAIDDKFGLGSPDAAKAAKQIELKKDKK